MGGVGDIPSDERVAGSAPLPSEAVFYQASRLGPTCNSTISHFLLALLPRPSGMQSETSRLLPVRLLLLLYRSPSFF
jgi:hypothetical protein